MLSWKVRWIWGLLASLLTHTTPKESEALEKVQTQALCSRWLTELVTGWRSEGGQCWVSVITIRRSFSACVWGDRYGLHGYDGKTCPLEHHASEVGMRADSGRCQFILFLCPWLCLQPAAHKCVKPRTGWGWWTVHGKPLSLPGVLVAKTAIQPLVGWVSETLTPDLLVLVRNLNPCLLFVLRDFSTVLRQETISFRTEGPERKMILAEKPKNQQIIRKAWAYANRQIPMAKLGMFTEPSWLFM